MTRPARVKTQYPPSLFPDTRFCITIGLPPWLVVGVCRDIAINAVGAERDAAVRLQAEGPGAVECKAEGAAASNFLPPCWGKGSMGVKSPERTASVILKKFTFVLSVVGCDN